MVIVVHYHVTILRILALLAGAPPKNLGPMKGTTHWLHKSITISPQKISLYIH